MSEKNTFLALQCLLDQEQKRQEHSINLIASENYMSIRTMQLVGSVAANKYAEGIIGSRYYSGCSVVDDIEQLAVDECKILFGAEYANVQPHSGSQANLAALLAFAKPGDTIMGMDFASGGHLTHGSPASIVGKIFNCVSYGVDRKTERLDYDAIEAIAREYQPRVIIAGASAYARIIDFERFAAIAHAVGAYLMVDMAHIAGLVAAGVHPSPVPYADCITSTTHKTLRGPRGGFILSRQKYAAAINRAVMPGVQGGPFMNGIAAKAYCFACAQEQPFVQYQQRVVANARVLSSALQARGYRIVSSAGETYATDTHLFVIDLRDKNITGRAAEEVLAQYTILTTRSGVPFDEQKPMVGSGIRIGTAAVATRGMGEAEMVVIARLIDDVVHEKTTTAREEIVSLCERFEIPSEYN